jgi:hypothetical protein
VGQSVAILAQDKSRRRLSAGASAGDSAPATLATLCRRLSAGAASGRRSAGDSIRFARAPLQAIQRRRLWRRSASACIAASLCWRLIAGASGLDAFKDAREVAASAVAGGGAVDIEPQ